MDESGGGDVEDVVFEGDITTNIIHWNILFMPYDNDAITKFLLNILEHGFH